MHLDHIYYDHDLIIDRVALHKSLKALVASDHLPLYADFVLRSEAEAEAKQTAGSKLDTNAGYRGATPRNTR
jgi:hypothetical protein